MATRHNKDSARRERLTDPARCKLTFKGEMTYIAMPRDMERAVCKDNALMAELSDRMSAYLKEHYNR